MNPLLKSTMLLVFFGLCFSSLSAQDFVYKAKNPYFGGDTFNYQWMLSSAQSQDNNKDPNASSRDASSSRDQNTLENFTQNLNRQILNDLSRSLVGTEFGENGLEEGSYTIGDYQIDVVPSQDGLAITIVDILTGGQTQIIVPYY